MKDADGRQERKKFLRNIFEPYWRDAVKEAELTLAAYHTTITRDQLLGCMFGVLPQGLIHEAARQALPDSSREDVELMTEIAKELYEELVKESLN